MQSEGDTVPRVGAEGGVTVLRVGEGQSVPRDGATGGTHISEAKRGDPQFHVRGRERRNHSFKGR